METRLALLERQVAELAVEQEKLKEETIAKLQSSIDKLEKYLSRIQNIAIGMALYFLIQQLGLADFLKAVML